MHPKSRTPPLSPLPLSPLPLRDAAAAKVAAPRHTHTPVAARHFSKKLCARPARIAPEDPHLYRRLAALACLEPRELADGAEVTRDCTPGKEAIRLGAGALESGALESGALESGALEVRQQPRGCIGWGRLHWMAYAYLTARHRVEVGHESRVPHQDEGSRTDREARPANKVSGHQSDRVRSNFRWRSKFRWRINFRCRFRWRSKFWCGSMQARSLSWRGTRAGWRGSGGTRARRRRSRLRGILAGSRPTCAACGDPRGVGSWQCAAQCALSPCDHPFGCEHTVLELARVVSIINHLIVDQVIIADLIRRIGV